MASEQEMMSDLAAADAAGDSQLAQHIADQIRATRQPQDTPPEQPGLVRRALNWMHEPIPWAKRLQEKQRAESNATGTGLLKKDSGDLLTGAGAFVSGLPGWDSSQVSDEHNARLAQFQQEHPVLGRALPIAGAFAQPMPGAPSPPKALPQATNMLRNAAEATITPTAEALLLKSKGVPLTVGQLNPRSAVGQIEEASTSLRGVGAGISAQREAAKKGWQQLAMGEAHPPGMPQVPPDWKPADALSAMYEGFKPSYQAVGNELIYPAIHGAPGTAGPLQSLGTSAGAMERAALDPSVLATDQTRQAVHGFLQHQLTILPEREGAVGKVVVGDLLQVRSNIRDAVRQSVQRQDFAAAQLLGNGEDAITKAIESQASPGVVSALKQIDSKYRAYKVIEDAVARAGDSPSGFSPSQLSGSIKSSMGTGQYARGGGGDLRELSRAGKSVFESVSPPTGARLLTVGPLGEYLTGPATFLANRPGSAMNALDPATKVAAAAVLKAALAASRQKRSEPPRFLPQAVSQAEGQ